MFLFKNPFSLTPESSKNLRLRILQTWTQSTEHVRDNLLEQNSREKFHHSEMDQTWLCLPRQEKLARWLHLIHAQNQKSHLFLSSSHQKKDSVPLQLTSKTMLHRPLLILLHCKICHCLVEGTWWSLKNASRGKDLLVCTADSHCETQCKQRMASECACPVSRKSSMCLHVWQTTYLYATSLVFAPVFQRSKGGSCDDCALVVTVCHSTVSSTLHFSYVCALLDLVYSTG